jgi:flavin reductase (DIM6/NTAB) family NADH-FMN oxidoreductase RutF
METEQHPSTTLVPDDLAPRDAYLLMLSAIVPRPIAWISTIGTDGTPNLAPFSFFNGVNGTPPIVMFSASRKRDGGPKDTLRNVQETGEFVVNIVDETLAEAMNLTSGEWDFGVSESERASLEQAPSLDVRPPRVARSRVAMEARAIQILPIEGTVSTLVLGRVVRYHIRQGLLRPNGQIDADKLRPVARLGGEEYATLGRVFTLARPRV